MSTQQPEALSLASIYDGPYGTTTDHKVAAELRRLHEVNAELLEALIKADVILYSEGFQPKGSYRAPIRAAIDKATGGAA